MSRRLGLKVNPPVYLHNVKRGFKFVNMFKVLMYDTLSKDFDNWKYKYVFIRFIFHFYFSSQIEFDFKSINQKFLLFLKSLTKNVFNVSQ